MEHFLVCLVLGLIGLLGVEGLAFALVLVWSLFRTTAGCPQCSRLWGLKPTGGRFKGVTRRALVTEAGSKKVGQRDEKVNIPLSAFEIVHQCQFCGYEEVRINLEVEDTPFVGC
jgi:hypothetical protein